jgi:hypothetical protein
MENSSPADQSHQRSIIIIIVVLVILALVGMVVIFSGQSNQQSNERNEDAQVVVTPGKTAETITEETKKGKLTPALGYESATGEAFIISGDAGITNVTILSLLPEPVTGTHYEAWLVHDTDETDIISLGVMEQHETTFLMGYQTEENIEPYNTVRITVDTIQDSTPETPVMEGVVQ